MQLGPGFPRPALTMVVRSQDRLATFGFADDGYPLVDEVFLPALTELSVAGGFLRAGEVRARCGQAPPAGRRTGGRTRARG